MRRIFKIAAVFAMFFVMFMPKTVKAEETAAMYRLYNPNSGEHFYTSNGAEKDHLSSLGWRYEGIGWYAPLKSNIPVYRLYNRNGGEHHYTKNQKEKEYLVSVGWKDEGVGWYSDDSKRVPVYRQYNPNERANNHNYTADENEKNNLVRLGWHDEGICWYAVKTGSSISSATPLSAHGSLHVGRAAGYSAPTILDVHNQPYQLIGASSHGLQWYPRYMNKDTFRTLRDDWGINTIRLAVYPKEGGYLEGSQNSMDETIQRGIQAASDLGMYVILDWHVLNYNPNDIKSQAKSFFSDYVSRYRSYDNILYEICNEPVNTPWYDGSGNDLYSYGTDLLKTIRSIDPDAIVICGTNTWSQDVDQVSSKPLNDPNVMYTLHFYAATHYSDLQNKLRTAVSNGTPVFVSEFGSCDASGNGGYDFDNADTWLNLLDQYNISYCAWALSNKAEAASYLKPSCTALSNWKESDLSEGGKWYRNRCRNRTGTIHTVPASSSAAGIQVQSNVRNSWNNGATIDVTLQSARDLDGWKVSFDLDGEITDLWNGTIQSHTGKHYVIAPASYNRTVSAGQSITFGFNLKKNSAQSGQVTSLQAQG